MLSAEDGLKLVATRGRLMQESGERAGDGSMLALLGTGAAERAAQVAEPHGLTVANDNAPNQVVLSGSRGAFDEATVTAKGLGLRAVPLPVTGAFHSPFMAEAVPEFQAALAQIDFKPAQIEAVSSTTTEPLRRRRRAPRRRAHAAGPLARDARRAATRAARPASSRPRPARS